MVFKGKQKGKFMTMEHLIPKSQGGTLAEDNIVAACKACNQARGDKSIYEFVKERETKQFLDTLNKVEEKER